MFTDEKRNAREVLGLHERSFCNTVATYDLQRWQFKGWFFRFQIDSCNLLFSTRVNLLGGGE